MPVILTYLLVIQAEICIRYVIKQEQKKALKNGEGMSDVFAHRPRRRAKVVCHRGRQ